MKKFLLTTAGLLAILSQTSAMAADGSAGGRAGAVVRVKASALGTDDWMTGKFVQSQGCTMVKLDRPSPNRYTSLMLIGISHLQISTSGHWTEASIASMLNGEPKPCRVAGSD